MSVATIDADKASNELIKIETTSVTHFILRLLWKYERVWKY